MFEVRLDGFRGRPGALMQGDVTATGIVVRLMPPLSDAIEADRGSLITGLIDWCETNVINYGERSCIQRHLRSLQRK
jgi:hypothetical protein